MDADLAFLPLTALSSMLARHQVSPVEIVDALLERIDRHNEELRSYITVCADPARSAARRRNGRSSMGADVARSTESRSPTKTSA
jgi:Asp-tRNA(Asn)/Glu-tRNA(Gln) amidotransferase A subunit family amidase